jgi:hypothetical protein
MSSASCCKPSIAASARAIAARTVSVMATG